MQAIILTKIEEDKEFTGTYGGQTSYDPILCVKSLTWINEGTSDDVEKAKKFAAEEGYEVHTYPSGREDHRELAEDKALETHRADSGSEADAYRHRNHSRMYFKSDSKGTRL